MILNLISEYVDYSFEFMIECFNPYRMKKNLVASFVKCAL
jgi:hypothetical protein